MAVRIITDSTSDIPAQLRLLDGVVVLPLTVHFGSQSYIDGVSITNEEFYKKLANSQQLPTTSQVTANTFLQVFKDVIDKGDEIIGIFISSELSGTCSAAFLAQKELGSDKIFIIDSRQVTLPLALLVSQAIRLRDNGYTAKDIYEMLHELKDKVRLIAKVDTLKYLRKGGRLSATSSVIGTLLNVKPLVAIEAGKVVVTQKARGDAPAIKMIKARVLRDDIDLTKPVAIGYSADSDLLNGFEKEICGALGIKDYLPISIGPTVGTHAGPNVIGVAYFVK